MFFLELSCFFHHPADVGNLISGSSAFSKTSLNIWKFTVHLLLKPGLENFEHYFTSMWDECNCVVVWAFFCIAFLWNWNKNWPFPVLWPRLQGSSKSENQPAAGRGAEMRPFFRAPSLLFSLPSLLHRITLGCTRWLIPWRQMFPRILPWTPDLPRPLLTLQSLF